MLKTNTSEKLVSVIVPIYNEEKYISECLRSLEIQSCKPIEIIVVNDGSTDNSRNIARKFDVKIIDLAHNGPGKAKNEAAKLAKGDILVFFDADMSAHVDYIEKLIKPIICKQSIGTYSSAEYISNLENIWSRCWNINNDLPLTKRQKASDPLKGRVFRAILRSEFIRFNGFNDLIGYEDDMSLSTGKIKSFEVKDAICYHSNPESLYEVFISSRWIGRSPRLKLTFRNLIRYSFINSLRLSLNKILDNAPLQFVAFKLVFDIGIFCGILFKNHRHNFAK